MSLCSPAFLTDDSSSEATITDAAFVNLAGIHTLHVPDWVTNAAFVNLAGIQTLTRGGRLTRPHAPAEGPGLAPGGRQRVHGWLAGGPLQATGAERG